MCKREIKLKKYDKLLLNKLKEKVLFKDRLPKIAKEEQDAITEDTKEVIKISEDILFNSNF